MRRLFSSSFLILSCIVASLILLNVFDVTRNFLDSFLIRGGFGTPILSVLIGVWFAIALVQFIPSWRSDLKKSLALWPMESRPYLSHLLRGSMAYIAVLIFLFSVRALIHYPNLGNPFEISTVFTSLYAFSFSAYCCLFLHDLRGLLFPSSLSQIAPQSESKPEYDWTLPKSVTKRNLGKPELRLELAKDLRLRAGQLRHLSFYSLAGIGMLLVVAVLVILFAGLIAGLDVGRTDIEKANSIVRGAESNLGHLYRSARNIEERIIRMRKRIYKKPLPEDGGELEKIDSKLRLQNPDYNNLFNQRSQLQLKIENQMKTVGILSFELTDLLSKAIKGKSAGVSKQEGLNLLIASGITRFGILFIIVFLMQVLVNLYRYTMRLSAYYVSQADALVIAPNDNEALLKIVAALSPAQVDFGKQPATPIQQLARALRLANEGRTSAPRIT